MITTNWTEYPSNPSYNPGKAYYPTVVKVSPTSYIMWSDCATGLQMATSTDGISWTNVGICTGLTAPAHCFVHACHHVPYRIWYWSGTVYSINAIRTATSVNGLAWSNDQFITQVGTSVITGVSPNWNYGSYGPIAIIHTGTEAPSIIPPVDKASVWANEFVMYYDGSVGTRESVGLAVSADGIRWQGFNNGVNPIMCSGPLPWDANYTAWGTVVKVSDDLFQFWYCGGITGTNEGIGYAQSADGIFWMKDATNPIFHKTDGVAWRNNRTYTPCVIGNQMWFSGRSTPGVYAIGYATGKDDPVPPTVIHPYNKAQVGSLGTRDGTVIVPRYNDWS